MTSTSRGVCPLIVAALAVVLLGSPAAAGIALTDETGARTMVSRGQIKVLPARGPIVISIDVKAGVLWLANSQSRQVWQGTVDQYCEGLRRLGGGAARPPRPVGRILVQSTTDTATIAGLPTRKYSVFVDGRTYEDVWLTPDMGLAEEMNIERAAETFGTMLGCLAGASRGGSSGAIEARPEYTRLYRLGWPLRSVMYEDAEGRPGPATPRMLVTKIESVEIARDEFEPPAGYARASLQEILGVVGRQ